MKRLPGVEKRKVMVRGCDPGESIIFITDAPEEAIRRWLTEYAAGLESGADGAFEKFRRDYYARVLFDGSLDPVDDSRLIGYDEGYDLINYI